MLQVILKSSRRLPREIIFASKIGIGEEISQDHASGRRAQQPAQQTAKDQRRARRGQRGEEAIQVCERLHGIP